MDMDKKKATLYVYVESDLPSKEDGWRKTNVELAMNEKVQKLSWRCDEWGSNNVVTTIKDLDSLTGQILTLCDAMFTDKEQKDALKSILRKTIHEWHDDKIYRYQM
jgi:hypothetical protein